MPGIRLTVSALALLTSLCCSSVCAAWAAESPVRPNPESAAGAGSVLSRRDSLLLAGTLLEQGRLDEAETLYAALRGDANQAVRVEALFQLGQIRLRQGRYRQAVSLFHEILNGFPGLVRVRLELARAHFLDRNYEDAAFQFELVKGGDLPPEVLANVDRFLDAIRRQKNWTVDFSFSPVSDSNINQVSGERLECIDFMGMRLCRPLTEKAGGVGLSADATLEYFRRVHQDWGLRASLGLSGLAYEREEHNDYSLSAALGPRYLWERGEASLQPFFRKRWTANREYSEEYGLRLDARQLYGRLLLNGGAAFSSFSYADEYADKALRGPSWNTYVQARYILTDRSFVQAGLSFLRQDTRARMYANDNWRFSLGAYHAFSHGLSLFVEGSLTQSRHQAPQSYVTRDYKFGEIVREDHLWQFLASLSSNMFERHGLTPVLQYTYSKRDSNIWTWEYERHRLNLLFRYRF